MQREHISIPKMICYALFLLVYYAVQSAMGQRWIIRGFHLDLLPCFVAAAALLDGPLEGLGVGLMVGLFYDVGFSGVDGIYPVFYMLFGFAAGNMRRLSLGKSYLSCAVLTVFACVLIGVLRMVLYLIPFQHASIPLVLQQIFGGALLAGALGFVVYLPMRAISRRFDD